MKTVLRHIFLLLCAVALALLQSTMWHGFLAFDLVIILAIALHLMGHTPDAFAVSIIAGVVLDFVQGWAFPGHAVSYVIGLGVFILVSRRLLVIQSPFTTSVNAFISTTVLLMAKVLFSGIGYVSLPGATEHLNWSDSLGVILWQSMLVAITIGLIQYLRRRSLVRVAHLIP